MSLPGHGLPRTGPVRSARRTAPGTARTPYGHTVPLRGTDPLTR
jgi:hypothetical protein